MEAHKPGLRPQFFRENRAIKFGRKEDLLHALLKAASGIVGQKVAWGMGERGGNGMRGSRTCKKRPD